MTKLKTILVTLLTACALLLPASAFASSIDIATAGGVLQFNSGNSTLNVTGSTVDFVGFQGKTFVGDLGTLNFSTGSLSSGSFMTGGTFSAGGSFAITLNGADKFHQGVLFSGMFTGPVNWNLITLANGKKAFTLTGALSGKWFTGAGVQGAVTVLTAIGEIEDGKLRITSADINLTAPVSITPFGTVPEPTSLLYMGTGIMSVLGAIRFRRK